MVEQIRHFLVVFILGMAVQSFPQATSALAWELSPQEKFMSFAAGASITTALWQLKGTKDRIHHFQEGITHWLECQGISPQGRIAKVARFSVHVLGFVKTAHLISLGLGFILEEHKSVWIREHGRLLIFFEGVGFSLSGIAVWALWSSKYMQDKICAPLKFEHKLKENGFLHTSLKLLKQVTVLMLCEIVGLLGIGVIGGISDSIRYPRIKRP